MANMKAVYQRPIGMLDKLGEEAEDLLLVPADGAPAPADRAGVEAQLPA